MTLKEIKTFFEKDIFATKALGAEIIDAYPGYAECRVKLTDIHKNAMGGIMGGVAYTLADFTFAVATNSGDKRTVSLAVNISYTGKPKGDYLISKAVCVKDGRSTCLYRVDITDDLGNSVAVCDFNGFHIQNQ